jgi:hypothetical protein
MLTDETGLESTEELPKKKFPLPLIMLVVLGGMMHLRVYRGS